MVWKDEENQSEVHDQSSTDSSSSDEDDDSSCSSDSSSDYSTDSDDDSSSSEYSTDLDSSSDGSSDDESNTYSRNHDSSLTLESGRKKLSDWYQDEDDLSASEKSDDDYEAVMEKKAEEGSLKDMKLVWLVEPSSVTFEEEEALDELLIVLLMDSILIDLWVVRI